ncbi:MAG: DUF2950 family protein [Planctomycetes bacterium]|nr:DUF2950 family protein [Planctomycetota bacterium]
MKIAAPIVILAALGLIALLAYDIFDPCGHDGLHRSEENAMTCLKRYHDCQQTFRRMGLGTSKHTSYAPDLKTLKTAIRAKAPEMETDFLDALSPKTALVGYYFKALPTAASESGSDMLPICAITAVYSRSGINTFIIDGSGKVYCKDLGGEIIDTFPTDLKAEGWLEW